MKVDPTQVRVDHDQVLFQANQVLAPVHLRPLRQDPTSPVLLIGGFL